MYLNDLPMIMIRALLLTIIIECVFAFIFGLRNKRNFLIVMLVNIMTNPIVVSVPVLVLVKLGRKYVFPSLMILEVLAVLSEGFVYKKTLDFKKINPYLFSFILNVISYIIGEVINRYI